MLRKMIAMAAAFGLTLFFSLGCPRQDANQQAPSPSITRDSAAAPATTATNPSEPPKDAHPTTAVGAVLAKPQSSAAPIPAIPNVPAPAASIGPFVAAPVESQPASPRAAPEPATKPDEKVRAPADTGANDPPFKGWLRPKAVIVCSGMQMGYIEPCGCSGLKNQKGGLSRRANCLKQLAADGWPVEAVDVGQQIVHFGKEEELKFLATADALKKMHYGAIAFGPDDLKLPAESLTLAVTDLNRPQSPFVSASVALFGFDQSLTPRFRVDAVGGIKIGITSILGDAEQKAINNSDVSFKPAAAALAEVVPQMKKAGAEHMVLLAQASKEETLTLVKQFPQFDFVVVSYGAPVPPRQPETAPDSKTRLIEVSQKAEYVNVIGLFDDPQQPVRFERVALDAHWGESKDMKRVMAEYQEQLKTLGLSGLGVTAEKHPEHPDWTFVGSSKCGECHTKAFAVWKDTPHAKALDTLVKLDPPRNFDPQCLSCHVTGWDPQHFRPFESGFESLQNTPQLANNGCENCHGPGSEHVAIESGTKTANDHDRDAIRSAMRITMANAEQGCLKCHDGDNSINFNFQTYFPKIAHHGKD